MAKGISVKFKSYLETIPRMLEVLKLEKELQKHNKIVLKPSIKNSSSNNTSPEFVEEILKFCSKNKNPNAEIFIAEGSDGEDTMELFESLGYKSLAERYSVGLIDLNNTEVEEVINGDFLKFNKIFYPKILLESFVISLPKLSEDAETVVAGALSNMLGAFPARFYKGFLSRTKSKIRNWPMKYSIHDILKCKLPDLAIIDASDKGSILVGRPLEMDKQAVKLLSKDWKSVPYIRLIDESFSSSEANKIKDSVQ